MEKGLSGFDGERSMSSCRRVLFAAVTLSLLVFAVYSNSLHGSFHLDDFHSIAENPNIHLKDLTWQNIQKTLRSDLNYPEKLYRPVSGFSFGLNYYFGGLEVKGYHLLNMAIHYLSALFLFLFLHQTLQLPSLKEKYGRRAYSIALLGSAFWAVHPIQTEAVTYVVQRMSSLAGMFYILAMYFYIRARKESRETWKRVFWISCLISSVLAFGSKENAALIPLALILCEILLVQKDRLRWLKKNGPWLAGALAFALVLGFVYLHYRRGGGIQAFLGDYKDRPFTLKERLLTQPRVILLYLSLLVYPSPSRLSVAHSIEISKSLLTPPSTLAALLLLTGFLLFLVFVSGKYPLLSFSYLFFFANHLLESSVFPLEMIFEHRNYIPSMMFFLPPAMGFFKALESPKVRAGMKFALFSFSTLLLVGFGLWTFERNFAWTSEGTLWRDAMEKAPDQFRPHHNLGLYYQQQGYLDRAIAEFKKALESPGFSRKNEAFITYYQLGKAYQELGRMDQARHFYEGALRIKPDLAQALAALAVLQSLEGREDLAEEYLHKALTCSPDDPYVNFSAGVACLKKSDRLDEAIRYLTVATTGASGVAGARALLYLGIAYEQKGQLGQAAMYFRKSVEANPSDVTPRLHLMETYQMSGQKGMARREAEWILSKCMQQNPLFNQTMELISRRGRSWDVHLSGKILFPIFQSVMAEKGAQLDQWRTCLRKAQDLDESLH
jgi:Tfp pilus assembly protein PilF